MSFYYSPETNCFYLEDSREVYEVNSNWPSDCLKVEDSDFTTFALSAPPENKIRGFKQGKFFWADIVVSEETLRTEEMLWVTEQLDWIRDELEKVQDSDTNSYGTVGEWREYRKLVRNWPLDTNFPHKAYRPSFLKE